MRLFNLDVEVVSLSPCFANGLTDAVIYERNMSRYRLDVLQHSVTG